MHKYIVAVIFYIVLLNAKVNPATPEPDSCYSYAGGNVYPMENDPAKTNHKLQWTQAVSKSFIHFFYKTFLFFII